MSLPPLKQVITADTSQFDTAIGGAMSTLKKFAGIAGIGAAIAGIKSMTRAAMDNIDQQAKLARSVGGTTAALQSLSRAGDRAGVQQSEMASAVTRLNQRLGQVIATGKGADDTFAALGVSAQELAGMDIDDRFIAIANSMKEAGMSTQEMSYHLRELGIRQSSVITLIQSGAEEIERSRRVMEEFGVSISEIDAAKIEAANDAMSEVGRVFEGLQNQLAVKLAPAIEAMANAFTEAAREGGPVHTIVKALVEIIPRLTSYLAAATAGFVAYKGVLVAARIATLGLSAATQALRVALTRLGIGVIVVAAGELIYQFQNLVVATGSFSGALQLLGATFREVFAGMQDMGRSFVLRIQAQFADLEASFQRAISQMRLLWVGFLQDLAEGARQIPFLGDEIGGSIQRAADRAGQGFLRVSEASANARSDAERFRDEAANAYAQGAQRIGQAFKNLQQVMQGEEGGAAGSFDAGEFGEGGVAGSGGNAAKAEKDLTERVKDELQRRFEALRTSLLSQEEALNEWYDNSLELLNDALAAEAITVQEAREAMLRLDEEFRERKEQMEQDGFENRLDRVLENLKTEEQLYQESYDRQLEILNEALARKKLSLEEFTEAKQALEERDSQRSIDRLKKEQAARRAIMDSIAKNAISSIGMIFEGSKPIAAAQALVNTYEGITSALRLPFPANIAAAAKTGAIGFAAVRSIRSASKSGAGGGAIAGLGSAGGEVQQQQPVTAFRFTLQNDPMGFGEQFARQMVDQINQASRNGGRVVASFG